MANRYWYKACIYPLAFGNFAKKRVVKLSRAILIVIQHIHAIV